MIIFPLAVSSGLRHLFKDVATISVFKASPDEVAAVVLAAKDAAKAGAHFAAAEGLPRFCVGASVPGYVRIEQVDVAAVCAAAEAYEASLLPPFVRGLIRYTDGAQTSFATPGHHAGEFFRRTKGGELFYRFLGRNTFRSDLSSSDSYMGDILLHEGLAEAAEARAAKVFHADQTYFVLNGTSASNKVCTNALLTSGDLVLFDRNNHKSVHHGALVQAGAVPIYLEATRNAYGSIGGMPAAALDEERLRRQIAAVAPERANVKRPFRLGVFQLGTYDGILYNAADILRRVGHLCDYILFDSAWVGYEQFIPFLADMSPLTLPLNEDSPGILVTQSVHKQLAGFAQTSQIHKKDGHIRGQARYVSHERFNNAFLLQASTSPNYLLFASLEMNAAMHEGDAGKRMWHEACRVATEAKKDMLRRCRYFRPFVPREIDHVRWEDIPTEELLSDRRYFELEPGASWHGFTGITPGQYCLDPCKLVVYTPGIELGGWGYEDFGVPAAIVSKFLQWRQLTPEKSDLNSLLFLITPAETEEKLRRLVDTLTELESALDWDAPLREVLPRIVEEYEDVYGDYTIRRLCQELHDFYRRRGVNILQRDLFRADRLPVVALSPQAANMAFTRGDCEAVPIREIEGRVALEGALPYPPGIITMVPGERWSEPACRYFLALEEAMAALPGFAPEIQGVHQRVNAAGRLELYAYVLPEN